MRLRNITGCREMIGESEFVVHEPETMKRLAMTIRFMWKSAWARDVS